MSNGVCVVCSLVAYVLYQLYRVGLASSEVVRGIKDAELSIVRLLRLTIDMDYKVCVGVCAR